MIFLIIAAVMLALVTIWFFIERRIVLTSRRSISPPMLPKELDGFKICHVSDMHLVKSAGSTEAVLAAAKREKPDIIVITGDLVSRSTFDFSHAEGLLRGLCGIAPVYFSYGNHESDLDPQRRQTLDGILKASGAVALDNASVTVRYGEGSFTLAGFSVPVGCYHNEDFTFRSLPPCTADTLCSVIGKKGGFTVLLAHNPLFFDAYVAWGAELTLSGHIHGGMVRLPLIGGILSPERRFFPKYSAGSYLEGDSMLYVSRGLGKLRLFNPREIVFLTLRFSE